MHTYEEIIEAGNKYFAEKERKDEHDKYVYESALAYQEKMSEMKLAGQWINEKSLDAWDRAIIVVRNYRRNSLEFLLGLEFS